MSKFVVCFLLILSWISSAFAAEVGVPIHVQSIDGKEGVGGVISAETSPQKPNALQILRADLQRLEAEAQKAAARDGVFLSTTKRFAPESITFFIAMGIVTFNSMWIKSYGDPLAMERQIKSLKDPIAHLSFYTFMQTQGFYMNFHTTSERFTRLDASTRAQMMRRLSYEGMAWGSIASSLVTDLGHSAKMCVDKWLKGKADSGSLASCDQAWSQWTVRNKFTQYFPQIISMWVAQMTTEYLEKSAGWGFQKISGANWMQKITTKDFLVKQAYKITGADVVTTFVGGGWVTKTIKFVGKVTRFSGFIAVDHILSNYTYRPINNIIQPALFEGDAIKIGVLWQQADAGNWDGTKIDSRNIGDFEKEIENYGLRMQQWRDHLNMEAEQDLAGWLEMTKRILSQVEYAYNFYRNFIGEWNKTINTFHLIGQKKLAASAGQIISRYPIRDLPLYGVKTGVCQFAGPVQDYYFLEPDNIEKCQIAHIKSVVPGLQTPKRKLKPDDLKSYQAVINVLNSGNPKKIGPALEEMNIQIDIWRSQLQTEAGAISYSGDYIMSLIEIKNALGAPEPKVDLYSGFPQAFSIQSTNLAIDQQANFSNWSMSKYTFKKSADLMMYKMLCGDSQSKLESFRVANINIFSPQFSPPTIFNDSQAKKTFCSKSPNSVSLYRNKFGNQNLKDFISNNFNINVFGAFTGPTPASPLVFEKWWLTYAKLPISNEFEYYDKEYKKVVEKAYDNYFNNRDWYKYAVDGLNRSLYLPKSLKNSLNAEANLYLQILNRVTHDTITTPTRENTPMPGVAKDWLSIATQTIKQNTSLVFASSSVVKNALLNFDYVEFATRSSTQLSFVSMYEDRSDPAVSGLNHLIKAYSNFFYDRHIDFNEYIEHSKKVDKNIHLILVKMGLEREVALAADAVEDFTQPASSGTENSPKAYEPIQVANPTYKQRMTIAAVKGVRLVEAEIRRFIRMKIALKNLLEVNDREIINEWNQSNSNRALPGNGLPYRN
jgi:hypothetical protein